MASMGISGIEASPSVNIILFSTLLENAFTATSKSVPPYDMKQLKGGDTMFQTQSMNLDLVRTFVIVCQSKDYNVFIS